MYASEQIALEMDDGSVTVMAFCTEGRSPTLPLGATWKDQSTGRWIRPATDENIWAELRKAFRGRNLAGIRRAVPLAFHRVKDLPPRDFRNSWTIDLNGNITEDVEKARQIVRDKIQVSVTRDLVAVNADYLAATMQGDKLKGDRIAQERATLEAKVSDPAIDAAQTVDELRALLP